MKEKNTATSTQSTINTIDDLNALIERVSKAQKILATYSQEQVDKICQAMALAAEESRLTGKTVDLQAFRSRMA